MRELKDQTKPLDAPVKFDYNNLRTSEKLVLDTVTALIEHERRFQKPIKTVFMNKNFWAIWCEMWKRILPEEEYTGRFEYMGCNIEFGGIMMVKRVSHDYWLAPKAEA